MSRLHNSICLLEGRLQVETTCAGHIASFAIALEESASRVDAAIDCWRADAEARLASLGASIAARILGDELRSSPERIAQIAKDAMREVASAESVRIRLNPLDSPAVRERIADVQAAAASVRSVEIVDDPAIGGGCLIESDSGVIDATIRAQIENALEALRGAE